jgi:hypothetical protein
VLRPNQGSAAPAGRDSDRIVDRVVDPLCTEIVDDPCELQQLKWSS